MVVTSLPKTTSVSDIPPERLAHDSALTEQQKIAVASRQFEAILLRQILTATQKTVIQSKFADNSTSAEIYRDMITTQLAESISKSGSFGLAQTFEDQLVPSAGAQPARETIDSRSPSPTPFFPSTAIAPGGALAASLSGAHHKPHERTVKQSH